MAIEASRLNAERVDTNYCDKVKKVIVIALVTIASAGLFIANPPVYFTGAFLGIVLHKQMAKALDGILKVSKLWIVATVVVGIIVAFLNIQIVYLLVIFFGAVELGVKLRQMAEEKEARELAIRAADENAQRLQGL
jgi:hypothetical protein